jgi:hypothetical protein
MLKTKAEYFALSRELNQPNRCPILDRCERRAHTLAIANRWPFEEAPRRVELTTPIVKTIGDPAGLIGNEEGDYIIDGQCPEVYLFETSMAIIGLSGVPLTRGKYSKYDNPQHRVIETGHFSYCAEYEKYVRESFNNAGDQNSRNIEAPEISKITLKWIFQHVPIKFMLGAVAIILAVFALGVKASKISIVQEIFGTQASDKTYQMPTDPQGAKPKH